MFKYVLVALLPVVFFGCKHDDLVVPDAGKTYRLAGDFIKNNYDLSLFNAAMEYTGLSKDMNGEGPFTLLVPGNTAFNDLGITRASDFEKLDKDSLKTALQYHILSRRLPSTEIPSNGVDVRYANLAGKEVYLTYASYQVDYPQYPSNYLFINGSYATKKDVVLSNGILYVIDQVMKYTPGTVQGWLAARSEYSVFVAALKQFGLWEQLAGEGPFTVFAPDNAALENAGITLESLPTFTTDRYIGARLFGVYILPKKRFFLTDFPAFETIYSNGGITATIANDTYQYKLSARKAYNSSSATVYTFSYLNPANPFEGTIRSVSGNTSRRNDNLTDNGVVHYMPQVLILPEEAKKN